MAGRTTQRYCRYTTKDGFDYIAVDHGHTFVTTTACRRPPHT